MSKHRIGRRRFVNVAAAASAASLLAKPAPAASKSNRVIEENSKAGTIEWQLRYHSFDDPVTMASYPLNRLLSFKDYPQNVLALHAQGYSVTRFLVERRDRPTFLTFVKQGMDQDWDTALERHYGLRNVQDLEKAWLARLRLNKSNERSTEKQPIVLGPQPFVALAVMSKEGSIRIRVRRRVTAYKEKTRCAAPDSIGKRVA